jgi:cysteine synthase A
LFDGVSAEMNGEEIGISQSTPRFRFDVSAGPAAQSASVESAKPEAIDFVNNTISDADTPVVMFALEWCEFCWSVRKMFAEVGISFKSVDLDSVAYQKDDLGGDIRAALLELTSTPTIPQIFVGGKHIGGCTETFDAFNSGDLQKLLAKNAVEYDQSKQPDAYGFLPTWLHPR